MNTSLHDLGFNSFFESELLKLEANTHLPARVIAEHKGLYKIQNQNGEFLGEISGKLRYTANSRENFPAVGDWVLIQEIQGESKCIIHSILPRKTKLSRKAPGKNTEEQILCSNLDIIFIVQPMDATFNVNRIERYLALGWESGALPIVILSKKDLCESPDLLLLEAESASIGTKVHMISSTKEEGFDAINSYLKPGITIAFIGQSGGGKSTLINKLIGKELQKTSEVREMDSKGTHTTTHRELFVLENGLLIDTPGLKEIQLWGNESMIEETFSDIEDYAKQCKFIDCNHETEPGCSVLAAIERGEISEDRFANYLKMKREVEFLESKMDESIKIQRKQKERKLQKMIGDIVKQKYGKR